MSGEFHVKLKVDVFNKRGIFAVLADHLSNSDAHIHKIEMVEMDSEHNTFTFLLNVRDRAHVAKLIKKLQSIKFVTRVLRVK